MTQSYRLFTTYSKIEDKNKYFQECIENEIVNIVVTVKRKYASVEWDLITLDNSRQVRKNDINCSLGDDIIELYKSYIEKVDFKKKELNYQIQNCCGIIYIFKEDVKEVLSAMTTLINNMIKSNCIEFTTFDEKYKDIPEHIKKYIGQNNLK